MLDTGPGTWQRGIPRHRSRFGQGARRRTLNRFEAWRRTNGEEIKLASNLACANGAGVAAQGALGRVREQPASGVLPDGGILWAPPGVGRPALLLQLLRIIVTPHSTKSTSLSLRRAASRRWSPHDGNIVCRSLSPKRPSCCARLALWGTTRRTTRSWRHQEKTAEIFIP